MFTAVADASQVAEARRLVQRDVAASRRAAARHASTRWRSSSPNSHQPAEAWRRRPYPGVAVRRCRRHRAGTAGAGSRQRHGRHRLAACRMATRPPAAPAPASVRSSAWPTICGSIRVRARARAIMARFVQSAAARVRADAARRGTSAPYPGEQVCGDNWSCAATPSRAAPSCWPTGSGHGVEAARAAETAVRRSPDNADAAVRGHGGAAFIAP